MDSNWQRLFFESIFIFAFLLFESSAKFERESTPQMRTKFWCFFFKYKKYHFDWLKWRNKSNWKWNWNLNPTKSQWHFRYGERIHRKVTLFVTILGDFVFKELVKVFARIDDCNLCHFCISVMSFARPAN